MADQYIISGDKKSNIPPTLLDAISYKLRTKENVFKNRKDHLRFPTIKEIQSILDPRIITSDKQLAEEIDIQLDNLNLLAVAHMELGSDLLFERDMSKIATLEEIRDFISED